MTQGHYSKVIRGRAPLSDRLKADIEAWLQDNAAAVMPGDELVNRMGALAASIRAQCIELMHLAEHALGASEAAGRPKSQI